MCHGHIDPKTLMIEAEARYRAAVPAERPGAVTASDGLPPELMGGVRGAWARIVALLPRRKPTPQVPFAAE